MSPLATAALDWVHLMQPIDHQQLAQDLVYLRDKLGRADIPAFTIDELLAAINELREAGRLERTAEGLKWLPVRESVGQGKLF
jgi:hypothetical protein